MGATERSSALHFAPFAGVQPHSEMKIIFPLLMSLLFVGVAGAGDHCDDDLYVHTVEPVKTIETVRLVEPVRSVLDGHCSRQERDARCEREPDKCVIKTYGVTAFGTPDVGLNKPKEVIEVDPATGRGKVYEPDVFGNPNKISGPIGEARKTSAGELAVYSYDDFGMIDTTHPQKIIDVEKPHRGERSQGKIYGVDAFGFKEPLLPVGAVTVECE